MSATDAGGALLGGWRLRMLAAIEACERELDRRNALPAGTLALRLGRLRALLMHGRLPRVVAVGRRGAGKSSLLNSLAGAELVQVGDVEDTTSGVSWREVSWGPRRIEWFDTPGFRAGGESGRVAAIADALAYAPPDAVLFLCQANEVDAGIDDDLDDLAGMLRAIGRAAGRMPTLIALITKVDELCPPDVVAPPFDDPEKRENIRSALSVLGRHLRRRGMVPHGVLPVNTYFRCEGDRIIEDLRWNLDALAARLVECLPTDAHLATRLLVPELRRVLEGVMADVTDAFASIAAAIASQPGRSRAAVVQDLESINAALARVLRLLAPDPLRGRALASAVEAIAGRAGPLELVRAGAARVGAGGLSAALAAVRVQALGAALARGLLAGIDEATLSMLFAP